MGAAQKIAGYFLFVNGEKFGPVSKDEVASYFAEGRILPTDLVWTEGFADWIELRGAADFSDILIAKPPSPPPAKSPKMVASVTPQSGATASPSWKEYAKVGAIAFVLKIAVLVFILAIAFLLLTAKNPLPHSGSPIQKNAAQTGAPPLDADLGPLGRLSTLLPRVAGKNGTVRWEARGNDFFAIITKPGGNSSIRFTTPPHDPNKAVDLRGDITEITVNGNPCHFSSLGDVAICIGLMAKAP